MTATTGQSKLGMVLRVTSGNFLEMFDFFLSGVYASYIAKAFFPLENEYASLLLTFVAFGAGFLMRPLGAIILGAYVDRIGRRKGLIVTLSIMASGTVLIAFVPSYATIGIVAPILVLIGRLLQGFSAGVELGGVSVYLAEMATPGRKGFYASWQSASQQVAIIVSAALGFALNSWLSPAQVDDWGWRIPFFIGCLIVPFVFFLRRSLQETDEFLARKHHPTPSEIYRSILANWVIVLAGMMMVIMTTVSFYLITVYTPTFGKDGPQADCGRQPDRYDLRGHFELHLASHHGRIVRSDWSSADPHCLLGFGNSDRISGAFLAGRRTDVPEDADGLALVVFHLCQLQRRDDRRLNRSHAGRRSNVRIFARLQPGDNLRWVHCGHLYVVDRDDWRQCIARILDERRGDLWSGGYLLRLQDAGTARAIWG